MEYAKLRAMADDEDQSSKTEDPTERKLNKLKEEGNVPKSREVNHLFMLVGMLLVIGMFTPYHMTMLRNIYGGVLNSIDIPILSADRAGHLLQEVVLQALLAIAPTLALLILVAWFGGFVPTGPLLSFKAIQPKLSRISAIKGFQRIFSMKSLMEFMKSLVKLVVIGVAMWAVMAFHDDIFYSLTEVSVGQIVQSGWLVMLRMILAALAIMVLIAIVDWLFEQAQFTKQNRMSRRELKDEVKETVGDPFVKQRQRQIMMQRAQQRMMEAVPEADVIITNPTHFSVALAYKPEEGMVAPTVVAKGVDHMAQRIREIAREHNIPLYEDPPLARQMYYSVEVDDEIPLDLYQVTAKVIAYIMNLKQKRR